jgi:hypothetical protein
LAHTTSLVLPLVSLLLLPFAAGCGEASSGDAASGATAALRFDPCHPIAVVLDPGATADQKAGVAGAVDWWNAAAGGQVFVAASAGDPIADAVPLHFQAAAPPSHGFFDPARGEIFINLDLESRPLAVTIAHELGHAFGLVHVTDRASVMTAGNLDVQPNLGDVAALAKLWGACGPAAVGPPS